MKSLLLGDAWDLSLDAGGNLAAVDGTPRVVQDVASYERVFRGEPWYDQSAGVPYLLRELAHLPPAELVEARANARALEVPGVAAAVTTVQTLEARALSGTIHVTTDTGDTADVSI